MAGSGKLALNLIMGCSNRCIAFCDILQKWVHPELLNHRLASADCGR